MLTYSAASVCFCLSFSLSLLLSTVLFTVIDISYWKMTAHSVYVTEAACLSIAGCPKNLKGHGLPPNVSASVSPCCSSRPGLHETEHWAEPLINAFSAQTPAPRAQKPHVGVLLPASIHTWELLYLQRIKHSVRKTAHIDWLVGSLFWVTFHKWSRLVK